MGMRAMMERLEGQPDVYVGSYAKVEGVAHPQTKEAVACWRFEFTAVNGKEADVPLNIPIYYAQSDLQNAGPIATQILPAGTKVDTVVSCFGVCYVCCTIHPLDYLRHIQTLFGPTRADNNYDLVMLEHGQTQHPDVIPTENKWVIQEGGTAFRHVFELMADSRMIIKDIDHQNETNQTTEPKNTFHVYQCSPNDQSEWIKTLVKSE